MKVTENQMCISCEAASTSYPSLAYTKCGPTHLTYDGSFGSVRHMKSEDRESNQICGLGVMIHTISIKISSSTQDSC
jgi:hypothetical protein